MTRWIALTGLAVACSGDGGEKTGTEPPPDVAGTWGGVIDCEPDDSGWGDPVDYTLDMTLDSDGDAYTGTLSYVFDATDPEGSLFTPGASVQLAFDVQVDAAWSGDALELTATACDSYTVTVDGTLDPYTGCDDISWGGSLFSFTYDGGQLVYDGGTSFVCAGALDPS